MALAEGLRTVIADDHAPTRMGVRQALELDGFEVVAAVPDGPRAVAAAVEHAPDVVVLDIHMPGGGIAAAEQISLLVPAAAVVMLTASRDDDDLFDALRVGARGYLLKDMDPDRLGAALRGVLAGEAALPRALVMRVMAEFATGSKRRPDPRPLTLASTLTVRESEVLELMALGLTTEEIAARMFIGQVTVRTHVSNVLKKLGVTNREAAVRLALGNGRSD